MPKLLNVADRSAECCNIDANKYSTISFKCSKFSFERLVQTDVDTKIDDWSAFSALHYSTSVEEIYLGLSLLPLTVMFTKYHH